MGLTKESTKRPRSSWRSLFLITFLAVYLYVFMEWLFDVTKPSFMSAFSFQEKVGIFLFSGALGSALCFLLLSLLALIGLLPGLRTRKGLSIQLGGLLPAAVLASLFLMMIDNFTYTVFGFGIVSTRGVTRGLYGALFVGLFVLSFRIVSQRMPQFTRLTAKRSIKKLVIPGLNGVILLSLLVTMADTHWGAQFNKSVGANKANSFPNIVFITGDGVDATHTSVYGYDRDTTPQIKELSETSLVAEDAFTNSGNTSGSLISFLTSKYPTQTRVLFPPDILRGADAYQHLPGMLRSLGYYSVQYGYPHYADAYTLNVLDGFDVSNGRAIPKSGIQAGLSAYIPSDYAYFIDDMTDRLVDRLSQIFYLKTMENSYDLVTEPPQNLIDQTKLEDLLDLIQSSSDPLFVQIHFMVTSRADLWP